MLWAKYPLEMLTKMPGRRSRVFQEHAAVLSALERNDPEGAVAAMQVHIKTGWEDFSRIIAKLRGVERRPFQGHRVSEQSSKVRGDP